jgi:mono/diheme cytochrome c family protein
MKLLPLLILLAAMALAGVGCQGGGAATPTLVPTVVPPVAPAAKVVWNGSYDVNVQPIFNQKCVGCHGPSRVENGLRLDSYDGVMKGTQFGPIVVPGQPSQSALLSVVKGTADPSLQMPHGGQRLNDQDVLNITLWIQAGAPRG